MTDIPKTLADCADAVLNTADGRAKTVLSKRCAEAWFESRASGAPMAIGLGEPPDNPARPEKPELLEPRDMPRRRPGKASGRLALIHAVAHIELNAVDLHWDIISRFTHVKMPLGFYDDWVKSAAEESKHFNLVCDVLEELGSHYGAMPAHAYMWQAASDTATDFLGRLAVVPMVLEARGLDVTPGMIELFRKADVASAVSALETIYAEEVAHVAYGSKWFHFLCGRADIDPKETFHDLVRKYFHGALKPPFNEEKRAEAGIPPDFYWPLADEHPSNAT